MDSFSWVFPLSIARGITAHLAIEGGPLSLSDIDALIDFLHVIRRAWPERPAAPPLEPGTAPVAIGDVVQLKPSADRAWGGLLLRVKQLDPVRGYLLIPHRGGCREAWVRLKACEFSRIGALQYEEAAWGFRPFSVPVPLPPAEEPLYIGMASAETKRKRGSRSGGIVSP